MSIQLYTQEQIVKHLENSSPTKFMYSFGRAKRFPNNIKACSNAFYELPSIRTNRSTSFGYGTKFDFTKSSNTKTEFVSIRRDFDVNNSRGPKYSFGACRDAYAKAFCPGYKNVDKNVPGPGKYNYLKTFGSDSPQYSIHQKLLYGSIFNVNNKTPGPGVYRPVIEINDKGKCPLSKFKNSNVLNFGSNSCNRFEYKSKFFFL